MISWLGKQTSNNLIGLDFGSKSIKLLKINSNSSSCNVEYFAIVDSPPDAFVKNEIKDYAAVSRVIRQMMMGHGISSKNVAIAIPRSSTITKTIPIDKRLRSKDIESRAWIEAHRYFPDLIGNIYLDFVVMGPSAEDSSQVDLNLVACRKDQITPYLETLRLAGLTAKILDVNSYAFERSLFLIAKKASNVNLKTIALLNFDLDLISLIVIHKNKMIYAHDESFDGRRLLGSKAKKQASEPQINENQNENDNKMDFLKEYLTTHLRHTMHFFYSSKPNIHIQKIILSGDCATIPNIDTFIKEELGIEVQIANPFEKMTLAPGVDKEKLQKNAPSLMLCCGLALSKLNY